jgi:hypothetical protein
MVAWLAGPMHSGAIWALAELVKSKNEKTKNENMVTICFMVFGFRYVDAVFGVSWLEVISSWGSTKKGVRQPYTPCHNRIVQVFRFSFLVLHSATHITKGKKEKDSALLTNEYLHRFRT